MKTNEIIDKLIAYLINEDSNLKNYTIPIEPSKKRLFLRGLINLRAPKPINENILKLEDELLQREVTQKNIIDVQDIEPIYKNMCICLCDITTLKIEAIVNAANSSLLGCFIPNHSCIDNAIHSSAGIRLRLKCHEIMSGEEEKTGMAKITSAYNLPSKFIIHTVGPIVENKLTRKNCQDLENCYFSCLEIARENDIRTLAFPSISTGVFHFPKEEASKIAVETVTKYMEKYPSSFDKIVFNVFTKEDQILYEKLLKNKRSYK